LEQHGAKIGSVEIELRDVGTVHLKLPVSDVKQLMDFVKSISEGWQASGRGEGSMAVRSALIERERRPLQAGAAAQKPGEQKLGEPLPARAPRLDISSRQDAIDSRIKILEEKIASLIEMNRQMLESLSPPAKSSEPRIPSSGTKYYEVLQEIVTRFGFQKFEGRQVTQEKRHVLSILNNKYNALEVVETRGRTNIYQVRKEILERILASDGTSTIVEIRGKDRKSCDAFLETNQKRYPGFTYAFIEGNGLRQRYRLFFKDRSVQVSVTSNLGRFVGNKTNLIVREA